MRNSKKTSAGITIISLVVTIIVLLILAGISINMLSGDNGIINKAGLAKEQTEIEEEKEIIKSASVQSIGSNKFGNLEKNEFQSMLNKESNGRNVNIQEANEDFFILYFEDSKRSYLVDMNGNIRKTTWQSEKEENGNTIISNGITRLMIGDYIGYEANSNGEKTYTATTDKTGTSIDQGFSTSYDVGGWRLLGIKHENDKDYLMIIPANEIKRTDNNSFVLKGLNGFLNGLNEINNICEIYGKGKNAVKARCIRLEDINKITGYNPMNTGNGQIYRQGEKDEYNGTIKVTRQAYASWKVEWGNGSDSTTISMFEYYNKENNKWISYSGENVFQIGTSITLTNTLYKYYPTTLTDSPTGDIKGIKQSSKEYELLFNNRKFYVGDNYCVSGIAQTTVWGVFVCDGGAINRCKDPGYLKGSTGNSPSETYNLLPIVFLEPNINLKNIGTKNGCAEWGITD